MFSNSDLDLDPTDPKSYPKLGLHASKIVLPKLKLLSEKTLFDASPPTGTTTHHTPIE